MVCSASAVVIRGERKYSAAFQTNWWIKANRGLQISRYKGLGEMNPIVGYHAEP